MGWSFYPVSKKYLAPEEVGNMKDSKSNEMGYLKCDSTNDILWYLAKIQVSEEGSFKSEKEVFICFNLSTIVEDIFRMIRRLFENEKVAN